MTGPGLPPHPTSDLVGSTLASLQAFSLGQYVDAVRSQGRMGLAEETRTHAASLYRRVREARATSPGDDEAAATLAFAEAVLQPQWAMQLPGGKRYRTYVNGPVLDWVLQTAWSAVEREQTPDPAGQDGDRTDPLALLRACGWTVHRKARNWQAYETATLQGTSSWNQVDVASDRLERRIGLLDKLAALCADAGWCPEVAYVPPVSPEASWGAYATESTGDLALQFLTTLPQTTQHDEVAFLNCIHVGECCFIAMGACLTAAGPAVVAGDLDRAEDLLRRARRFADAFDLSFKALAVMPQEHFLYFVEATGQASAVQSRSYQELQILLYRPLPGPSEARGQFPELDALADIRTVSLEELLAPLHGSAEAAGLLDAAHSLDSALYRWRARHYGASRRYYPFSGLELGSGYLEGHYRHRLPGASDSEDPQS